MRRTALIGTLAVVAGVLLTHAAAWGQPRTWDYGGKGQWGEVRGPATQPAVNPALDRVSTLVDARRGGAVIEAALAWLKDPANAAAPDRDRALALLADGYVLDNDLIIAYYHLDELMDKHPESRLYYLALEKQYAIADMYLRGRKDTFLGLPIVGREEEAIDMLFRIQSRAPGSPIAERSLMRTADYYFDTSQFDFSTDAYGAYVRAYPRSPEIARARLRQAFSSYAQYRGRKFDATALLDARAQFEDIKVRYPDLAAESNVQEFLERINEQLAKKMLATADFYRRTGKPVSAAYTLDELIVRFPNTAEAEAAKRELAALPPGAVERARAAPPEAPSTTQPAAPGPILQPGR